DKKMSQQRAGPDQKADKNPERKTPQSYSTPASGYIGILRLQSTIGNQAVQRVLSSKRTHSRPPGIQRFEGPEHAQLGDSTNQNIDLGNGVILTWGQVIAIAGDEVGSVEELKELVKTDAGKGRLRAMLEAAGVPGEAVKTLPAPTDEQKKAQKG